MRILELRSGVRIEETTGEKNHQFAIMLSDVASLDKGKREPSRAIKVPRSGGENWGSLSEKRAKAA